MAHSPIILASQSIDRKALLERIRIPFEVIPSDIKEKEFKKKFTNPYELVQNLAKEKALAVKTKVKKKYKDAIIIAADTIAILEKEIIGKAQNENNAFEILRKLMGHSHQLVTGIAVFKIEPEKIILDYDETTVKFLNLSDEEIWNYIKTDEWRGRSGAYSIRERASLFIKSLNGSYSNVLGLPVQKLYTLFKKEFNINLFRFNI